MITIPVKTSILNWAIERSGKSTLDLENKFPKLKQWLAGDIGPSMSQLEKLAQATHTPLGLFFLDSPPVEKLPIPHYRTIKGGVHKPSPDLLETIYAMERRQEWMRENLINDGAEPLPFVKCCSIAEEPSKVAEKIRNVLGFRDSWASEFKTWTEALERLRNATEDAGILVMMNGVVGNNNTRPLDTGEFRGFVLIDEYAPLVFINSVDSKAAQMFTLAHEIAHVFFGISAAFDLDQMIPATEREELACNRVAAEFLVPEALMTFLWSQHRHESDPYEAIARSFKVSVLVVARRALDLKLITRSEFFAFYREYTAKEFHKKEHRKPGGNYYDTQGTRISHRFAEAILTAVKEGRVLYTEAYALMGMRGKTFENFYN